MRRGWIVVALIILLLVFVLARYGGECMMNTPWGNVGINVISDFVSVQMVTEEECICRKSLASQAVSLDVIF